LRRERSILAGGLHVETGFLANAIEHYRLHPEFRAAIGSEAEYQRLDAALREWVAAYATSRTAAV